MTDLNITLSSDLRNQLTTASAAAGHVNFQIVIFDESGTTPIYQQTYTDSSIPSSTINITLPTTAESGKAYFIIQSQGTTTAALNITQQSDINWTDAQDKNYRYDSIEFNLSGSPNDKANLTSVAGFGTGMILQVPNGSTTESASFQYSASTLQNTYLHSIGANNQDTLATFSDGPLKNSVREAISPTTSVGQAAGQPGAGVYSNTQWASYIDSLQNAAAADKVHIAGYFNGAKDANGVYHNGSFYSYHLEWDAAQHVFWLSPTEQSQVQGYIKIDPTELQNSIYSTLGDVEIYKSKSDTTPYQILDNGGSAMNVGDNNQWGTALRDFLTGFTAGFYGVNGQSLNAEVTSPIDLNNNWNWDPTYGFGQHLVSGQQPVFQDPYSAVFFANSNSYGSAYADALMSQYSTGGPLLSLYDSTTSSNVAAINVTLLGDGETPSSNTANAYVTPTIYNYIAPTGGHYQTMPATEGDPNTNRSLTLSFENASMRLKDDVPVTLQIYGGEDASGHPIWHSASMTGSDTPWATWNFNLDSNNNYILNADGTYSVSALPNTSVPGSMTFAHLPTAQSGVSWYRIVVGDGDAQKIYNLYTTTSGYQFVAADGSQAIDGLAAITLPTHTGATVETMTVNMFNGTSTSLDPSLLHQYTDANYTTTSVPNAAVAGVLSGTAGSVTFTAFSGQTNQVSNSITLHQGESALGWTGTNNDSNTSSWISGITNKLNGLNVALLSIVDTTHHLSIAPVAAQADLDGQWQTQVMQQLGNGTYTVNMTEYSFKDTDLKTALTSPSSTLTLHVDMAHLGLQGNATGLNLVSDSSGTAGNWIDLDTTASSLPPEATLILYRTNNAGQMIDANGQIVSDVKDAALAYVGAVQTDHGTATLFDGHQQVYLGTGQNLNFAIQTGQNTINTNAPVTTSAQSDGSVAINVGGIQLKAAVNNTLDDAANMASVQRMYDFPMVYAHHGEQLDVNVAGSTADVNSLHFVRLDANFDKDQITVGGVAYGNTDAFRAAVAAHLDSGYSETQGASQNFQDSKTWTVAGADGFYIPVMISQHGDVFVPGTANVDGAEHVRTFGANTFGFEDLTAAQHSDFDYNDMVMQIHHHDGVS